VRVENILVIFQSMYEAGRWPISLYPGWLRYGLNLHSAGGFRHHVPAEALTSRLSWGKPLLGAVALARCFCWSRGILAARPAALLWSVGVTTWRPATPRRRSPPRFATRANNPILLASLLAIESGTLHSLKVRACDCVLFATAVTS